MLDALQSWRYPLIIMSVRYLIPFKLPQVAAPLAKAISPALIGFCPSYVGHLLLAAVASVARRDRYYRISRQGLPFLLNFHDSDFR